MLLSLLSVVQSFCPQALGLLALCSSVLTWTFPLSVGSLVPEASHFPYDFKPTQGLLQETAFALR